MTTFEPTSPHITYIGRWADLPWGNGRVKLAIASGGSLQFKFTGPSVQLAFVPFTVDPHLPEISYSIDGQPPVRIPLRDELTLTGLDATEHTFVMWVDGVACPLNVQRWTCRQGVGLRSVTLAANEQLAPYPTGNSKRLLIIGDSIGEGLLMLGGTVAENFPKYAQASQNFGNQLGALLQADVWFQCFGGVAISLPFRDVPPAHANYPFILEGCAHHDPPFDGILIEAGHNDAGVAADRFVADYLTLTTKVRQANPQATVFLFPPLPPYVPEKVELVRSVAAQLPCVFIANRAWQVTMPNQGHPDLHGHTQLAHYLQPIIRPHLTSIAK